MRLAQPSLPVSKPDVCTANAGEVDLASVSDDEAQQGDPLLGAYFRWWEIKFQLQIRGDPTTLPSREQRAQGVAQR